MRTKPALILVLLCSAWAFADNVSVGYAGTSANNADAGDVMWSTDTGCTISDNTRASAAITSGSPTTQWMHCTNFTLDRAIPATATITGLEFWIEAYSSTGVIQVEECRAIKAGTRSSTDLASGAQQQLWTYEYCTALYGDQDSLCGETWTYSDINGSTWGVAFRLGRVSADCTVYADSVRVTVHWTDTPAAVITLNKATSPMAPAAIHAHITDSVIGSSNWDKVFVKWAITGPGGWTMTATDPRPGSWGASRLRNCATDMTGYNVAIWADVAGSYTIACTIYLEDGSTITDSENVTVAADTRTIKYVDYTDGTDDGAHGGASGAGAWKTLDYAIGQLTNDMTLVLSDDESWTITTADSARQITESNVVIKRSGGGTNKPIVIDNRAATSLLMLGQCSDVSLYGLDLRGDGTNLNTLLGTYNSSSTTDPNYNAVRLSVVSCAASTGLNSFFESAYGYDHILIYGLTLSNFRRYGLYGDYCSDVVSIGNVWTSETSTGEGFYRLKGMIVQDAHQRKRANALWCSMITTNNPGHAFFRSGMIFTNIYQCYGYGTTVGPTEHRDGNVDGSYPQLGRRMDGLYITGPTGSVAARFGSVTQASDITLCNSVFDDDPNTINSTHLMVLTNGRSRSRRVTIAHNIVLHTNTGGNVGLLSTDWVDLKSEQWDYTFRANYTGTDPNNTNQRFYVSDVSASSLYFVAGHNNTFANNVYQYKSGSNYMRWYKTNTLYGSTAAWNAIDEASGEQALDSTNVLSPSDFSSANNWIPNPATWTTYNTASTPHAGIVDDYRGVLRDPNAATWPAGVTGLEAETSGPAITVPTPTIATAVVAAAVLAGGGWILLRGRRFVDTGV